MADVAIDQSAFGKRLRLLYTSWKSNRSSLWEGANALGVVVGSTSEDLRYLKSISLHLWLFGYELPDTVLVFTDKELHVLTSQKKANLLQPLKDQCQSAAGVALTVHVKAKGDDGGAAVDAMLAAANEEAGGDATLGHLPKDQHQGALAGLWASKIASAPGVACADVSGGFADLFGVKDEAEVLNVKKAAFLAGKVMGNVVERLEEIIDQEKNTKHSKLSEIVEGVVTEPTKIGVKLRAENCDIAYPPVFQSGGRFDLKLSASSDDANLAQEGVITVALGTRYSSYCANIARTYIVDGSKQQEGEYRALLAAQAAVIAALREGAAAADAYAAAQKSLALSPHPHLAEKLLKNVGFGMGLEFRESHNVLGPKNAARVKAGQVFNVVVGLSGLSDPSIKDAALQNYALQVADTVVVKPGGGPPDVMTAGAPKDFDKISYTLKGEDEEEEEARPEAFDEITNGLPGKKLRSDDPNFKSAEQARREEQDKLLRQKNDETLRRLTAARGGSDGGGNGAGGRAISQITAYRSINEVPQARELRITIDGAAEAVLLPLYGVMVPFHITTFKSITMNQDNDHAYVRVSFNFGGAYEPAQRFPQLVFLKDLTFRTSDVRHATKVVQEIKLLRSTVLSRDKERAERATLVVQEKLIRGKRVYRLPDLWVRPGLGGRGRKIPGALEAHANGFRYMNPKGEGIDVMYRNIRHAFFQPAEKEMVTILHFHLNDPIMMGNKKTKDVQFYAEVMDVVQTLDGGRRAMHDPDELEEEQRERERRNKINADFGQFVKRVQELWEKDYPDLNLEFDIPFRELAFDGVPHRSTVTVMPTVNCIVELTEMPFTVVPLEDIEVVNLERVGFNLKNFDMAIVFKDFSRDVLRIDAIPTKKLDTIRDWLVSVKIKYFESKLNLSWKPILKSIMEDPQGFVEQGGWDFLNMDKSDSEDEDEASSEGFQPSGSAEEEESSDYSSDEDLESEGGSGSDEDGSDEGEEEDEGLSWEELEEEARRDDKERDMEEDEEDQRPRKRKAGGGGGGSGGAAAKRRR
ncbi:MAG: global transcription factor [Monoraphidium minutum]|nr:MAG: global transcription factor [Monoraphidium minutum]